MSETDKLRALLDGRGVDYEVDDGETIKVTKWAYQGGHEAIFVDNANGNTRFTMETAFFTIRQAVDATLGRRKAKSHPYGYEPDTGAFDATRCECGCINDISADFCNDCGGEIEIDKGAEKEIEKYGRPSVFALKHDDGTLEFGGKRYVDATLGREVTPMLVSDDLGHVLITLGGIKTWDVTEDAAALWRGECELREASWDDGQCTWGVICSACGTRHEHTHGHGWNFAPCCGKEIKR